LRELIILTKGSGAIKKAIVARGAVGPLVKSWSTNSGKAKDYAHDALFELGFKDDGTPVR